MVKSGPAVANALFVDAKIKYIITEIPRRAVRGRKGAPEDNAPQYAFDLQLHDLRSEFISRESKLRQAYLDRIAAIAAKPTDQANLWTRPTDD
jgi:hypothetical protein